MELSESKSFQIGEKFSSAITISVGRKNVRLDTRLEVVTDLCRGKKVIHVGCVDHQPLIKEKIANNTWLHKLLSDASSKCIGVDINQEGIDFLKSIGIDNVVHADILKDDLVVLGEEKWDVIMLGEVIEHIDDPTAFLTKIVKNLKGKVDAIIITTPNGFRIDNFKNAFRHQEAINTDHRYWFTPYTLSKAASRAGIDVKELVLSHGAHHPRRSYMRLFYKAFPMFAMNLILVGNI